MTQQSSGRFGTPRRWGVFLLGLTLLITGIATSIEAGLGVGSWQVLETGLMATTGQSFAVVAVSESALILVLALVWLGQKPWIATAVLAFAGLGIDALLAVLEQPVTMGGRIGLLSVGLTLTAVGVAFYLASDLGASAQDEIFVGVYQKYTIRPGVVRFVLDGSLVVIGVLLGGQFGIGTIAATVGIPLMIEPALRVGHRLADTPLPAALQRPLAVAAPAPPAPAATEATCP